MKLLKELKAYWDGDLFPTGRTALRLVVVLTIAETLICLGLIQIINAII